MKITGTNSYIKVEINNKTVKIEGEMLVDGFVAFSDTITNWEPPYENEKIDKVTKQEIITAVTQYTKDSHFKITFE